MAVFSVTSPIRPAERVSCPTCGAVAPWRCRTRSGRSTKPHVGRERVAAELRRRRETDRCFVLDVDGEPVRVQGDESMSNEGRVALAELIRVARRLFRGDADRPDGAAESTGRRRGVGPSARPRPVSVDIPPGSDGTTDEDHAPTPRKGVS